MQYTSADNKVSQCLSLSLNELSIHAKLTWNFPAISDVMYLCYLCIQMITSTIIPLWLCMRKNKHANYESSEEKSLNANAFNKI